jgi:hypothetical protein
MSYDGSNNHQGRIIMNTSKLADIAEITSSIAILVTLVFLVVQMQQNTEAIQANGLQAALAQELEWVYKMVENPRLGTARTGTELTVEEQLQVGYHLAAYMRMREHDWLQYQKGTLDAETWAAYSRPIAITLTTQRARDWWRDASPFLFDPSFVSEVKELLAENQANEQAGQALQYD